MEARNNKLNNSTTEKVCSLLYKEHYELTNTGLAIFNDTFKIIKCNSAFKTSYLFHLKDKQINIIDKLTREEREHFLFELTNNAYYNKDHTITDSANNLLFVNIEAYTLLKDQTEGNFYKLAISDLTKEKKLQTRLENNIRELEEKNKQLELQNEKITETNKLTNLFLANTSHELRTPLNAIIGFSDLLVSNSLNNSDETKTQYAKYIKDSGLHLLSIINDILDLSKIEAGKISIQREEINAYFEINNVIRDLQQFSAQKNISIINDVTDDSLLYADRKRFRQIIYNLINNSIKFTNNGGYIQIGTEEAKTDNTITFFVKDNGIGINDKNKDLVFEPFYQTNSQYNKQQEGVGLGLSLVKRLVEEHNGKIWLESADNLGTTVSFSLPTKKGEPIQNVLYISHKDMPTLAKINFHKHKAICHQYSPEDDFNIKNVKYQLILINNDLNTTEIQNTYNKVKKQLINSLIPIHLACFDNINNIILDNVQFIQKESLTRRRFYSLFNLDQKISSKNKSITILFSTMPTTVLQVKNLLNEEEFKLIHIENFRDFKELINEITIDYLILDFKKGCGEKEKFLIELKNSNLQGTKKLIILPDNNCQLEFQPLKHGKKLYSIKSALENSFQLKNIKSYRSLYNV